MTLAFLKRRIDVLQGFARKAWTDVAREAALEARRKAADHRGHADNLRYRAMSGSGNRSANIAAAHAHVTAAQQYELASRTYGDSLEAGQHIRERADFAARRADALAIRKAYDPDEERDEHGRWASTGKAEEMFSDYDTGASMKAASGGERAKAGDMLGGRAMTEGEAHDINSAADHLQHVSQSEVSSNREVWRGLALSEGTNVRSSFPHNKVISFDTLTATSGDRTVAEKYTDPQFIGEDRGEQVLLRIGARRGVIGHDSRTGELAGAETILPAGSKYRVAQYRKEGKYHIVDLYDSGKLNTLK